MDQSLPLSVPTFFRGRNRHGYGFDDREPVHWSRFFRAYKLSFDIGLSIMVLPVIIVVALVLLILNPWLNPGPLFFRQERLGWHQVPFRVLKFRTMTEAPNSCRSHECGLETHRITPLGRILRGSRIDELPNFINVLRGEMSVVGPRPDAANHAHSYLSEIPHYRLRYLVKPGITGLAQIELGYAEGTEATSLKAHYDQLYVETSCGRLDVWIAWRTIYVMLSKHGAK